MPAKVRQNGRFFDRLREAELAWRMNGLAVSGG
jgi:hypothetical protein